MPVAREYKFELGTLPSRGHHMLDFDIFTVVDGQVKSRSAYQIRYETHTNHLIFEMRGQAGATWVDLNAPPTVYIQYDHGQESIVLPASQWLHKIEHRRYELAFPHPEFPYLTGSG